MLSCLWHLSHQRRKSKCPNELEINIVLNFGSTSKSNVSQMICKTLHLWKKETINIINCKCVPLDWIFSANFCIQEESFLESPAIHLFLFQFSVCQWGKRLFFYCSKILLTLNNNTIYYFCNKQWVTQWKRWNFVSKKNKQRVQIWFSCNL